MKLLISRAQYARMVAGMSPIERSRLDELVDVYAGADGEIRIDTERLSARVAELIAEPPPSRPAILDVSRQRLIRQAARQAGKTEAARRMAAAAQDAEQGWPELPAQWDNVGYVDGGQVWTAPPDTPCPFPTPPARPNGWPKDGQVSQEYMRWLYEHDPDQLCAMVGRPSAWLDVDDLIDREALRDSDHSTRRNWLNTRAPQEPRAQLPARELRVGQRTCDALREVATDRPSHIPTMYDFGVPIVLDPQMPAGGWQIVDVDSGDVLFEGHIGPTADDYRRDVLY